MREKNISEQVQHHRSCLHEAENEKAVKRALRRERERQNDEEEKQILFLQRFCAQRITNTDRPNELELERGINCQEWEREREGKAEGRRPQLLFVPPSSRFFSFFPFSVSFFSMHQDCCLLA